MKRARILTTAGVFALGLFLGWYGGIDYTQRSFGASWAVFCSIAAAGWAWSYPGWRK